jgi:hypothetical protein
MGEEVYNKNPCASEHRVNLSLGRQVIFKPSGYLLSLALAYYNIRNQLVKEYVSVSDAEEADKLAFNANREQHEQKA